jgi:acyl-CoA thioester hydrolase
VAWEDFRHRLALRVRWAEVDMQGVVFNGHYLTYCDVCITEYWRGIGLQYPQEFHAVGQDTFVRKASVDYLAAARYDDELEVCGRVAQLGRTSLRFDVEIFRRGATDMLVHAELVYVNVDLKSSRPIEWPAAFRNRVRSYEVRAPEESAPRR